jgi:hypothetical protein
VLYCSLVESEVDAPKLSSQQSHSLAWCERNLLELVRSLCVCAFAIVSDFQPSVPIFNQVRRFSTKCNKCSRPSASRMMDKNDPYPAEPTVLLDTFESALRATMQPNFWPSMGGGGLEQVGATQAINELLLQSYEAVDKTSSFAPSAAGTFLRFFPGWPLGERASFKSLRAIGGFLVAGSIDPRGVVRGVSVLSEVGGNCTFMPFHPGWPVVQDSTRGEVKTARVGDGLCTFTTRAGERYSLS